MEKKLSRIIDAKYIKDTAPNPLVTGLSFDSRTVKPGHLFFALPGIHVHGNTYIPQALEKGASVVLYQEDSDKSSLPELIEKWGEFVAFIEVEDTRYIMAAIANAFYDAPSDKLVVLGVTGTEGKSTTVFLLWQLLRLMGKKAGFISTVEYSLGDEAIQNPEHQTTPEAPIIQEKLYQMLQNGCEYAVVESSSHGLSEKTNRLGNILFDAAACMNVTHEHLEFHGTHEQYRFDKANLFRKLDSHDHKKQLGTVSSSNSKSTLVPAAAAMNLEDPAARYFTDATAKKVTGFTTKEDQIVSEKIDQVFYAADIVTDETGVSFNLIIANRKKPGKISLNVQDGFSSEKPLAARINLPGAFNVYNTLAALILVSTLLQKPAQDFLEALKELKPVRGRMTPVRMGQDFEVLVDYAHTPSSFATIFPPLKKRAKGRIISLFGSGGERDVLKRPAQGKIAAEWSDIVILADEDPRGEDPTELLEMIAEGCTDLKRGEQLFIIPDRPTAIKKAFSLAQKDDMVLLLGKGHENSIIFKDHTMPYDEITQAKKALREMGYTSEEQP